MEQDVVIEVKGLVKTFGKKAVLNGLNMTIRRGDIYGFIGNNGSGKTTAMKIILGLLEADSGDITLFGSKDLLAERRKIGSLIEVPGLYKGCTAKENMKRFAMLFGGEVKEIDDLLSFVGLGDVGKKKVRAFSLGMKQRLGIAVALLGNPVILVLDEPTNGLDPAGIKDLRELFEKIASEKGVSLLISSHHLDELSRIANVYGILVDGRIVDETRKDDILAKCGTIVLLESSDPSKVLAVLSPKGKVSVDGTKIRIEGNLSSGEVASLLVKEGVPFTSIQEQSLGFEDYFIERMGR